MSSKPRFPISGMNRSFLATQTPAQSDEAAAPTSLARRGIAISGAGRRLGISGMRRPSLETPPTTTTATTTTTTTTTPDDSNKGGLP
jgi:hypothetical protein